jgi:superfamily II DNA or RNA helicase
MNTFNKDDIVKNKRFGRGQVQLDNGDSIIVRFDHGLEECLPHELAPIISLDERMASFKMDVALNLVTRILGHCILSVNDSWGVFSSSRIDLLPHQLWVCKRVLENWPARWLIADDVGLGKTIEAGLILTPLLSSGRVNRLLILTPSSLVEQWQMRLREMFDIRLSIYSSSMDKSKTDYWNTHDKIIASAHTIRMDIKGRWVRLMESQKWDLVIVDEAHHMNVDENRGRALAFQIVEHLQSKGKIDSMILFTGTPHRGKDFGFLSLLKLLRPDDFDPKEPLENQIHKLRSVMIRNNKQRVTDMKGNPIFTPVNTQVKTYSYSDDEALFYSRLTEFISTGKAYAAGLSQKQKRTAILVLITMQKLASSSVAAVRKALANRLERLKDARSSLKQISESYKRFEELQQSDDHADSDEIARLEEKITEFISKKVHLNPDEIPAIKELLEASKAVKYETKIKRIIEVIDALFSNRSVLIFTEYKATQALLISELIARYGKDCVTFINGDEFIEGVKTVNGDVITMNQKRSKAADLFNKGIVRFLVSTEAAGEGIDLQENCSTLIHADLPWNPMRLHQRVGRLSRYGQTLPVDVVSFRNTHTIESRIWECLDQKLDRISLAFQGAMDDPEDMKQQVIGMATPQFFRQIFADADPNLKDQSLEQWFDSKTATFGGQDAIVTVKNLFGNVSRFDFGEVAGQIPEVDLPEMIPFFKSLFAVMNKRPGQMDNMRLHFKTPKQWQKNNYLLTDRYNLLFSRKLRPERDEDIAGIGLKVVDQAIQTAIELTDVLSSVGELTGPLVVFAIRDRITGSEGAVRNIIVGLQQECGEWKLLRDWQIIKLLNPIAEKPRSKLLDVTPEAEQDKTKLLLDAKQIIESRLKELDLPFQLPVVESLACLIPGSSQDKSKG